MANNENEHWVTPVGVAVYPRLNEPDTKFDPNGVFSVTLRLNAEEGTAFLGRLEKKLEAYYEEQVKLARKPSLKKASLPHALTIGDDGAETGEHEFKFKLKHNVTTRAGKSWTQRPKLFDSELKGFTGPVIGGGSELILNFSPITYYTPTLGCGITLRLKAAQVIKFVAYESKSMDFGFEAQSDGFKAPEELEPKFNEDPVTSADEL